MTTEACPLCSFKNARLNLPDSTALDSNPRLSRYVNSNAQIDASDSSFIHEDMASLLKVRVELVERMLATQSALKEMMFQRKRLDAAIKSRRVVLAPIRLLSDDILGAIFMWCTPTLASDLKKTPDSLDVLRWSPWVISHVCHRWRSVSLAHKCLWSTIVLCLPSYRLGQSSSQLLMTMLQRATPCELDIAIDLDLGDVYTSGSLLLFQDHFLEMMMAVSTRIRSMRVGSPDFVLCLLAGNPLLGLECLHIDFIGSILDLQEPPVRSPSFAMPKLHTLVYDFATPLHGLDLPWAQLKNVFFGEFKTEMLALLADKGLEVLHLYYTRDEEETSIPRAPLVFPELHTLRIDVYDAEELHYFFALVCGPKLKTLKIVLLHDRDLRRDMLPSVEHYPGGIERLDIACKAVIDVTPGYFASFFKPLCKVRECYVALPEHHMRTLFNGLSADNTILPCLHVLRLSADMLEGCMDELSQAIAARKDMHNVAQLAVVEVSLLKNRDRWDNTALSDSARMKSLAKLRKLLDCDFRTNIHSEDNAPWDMLEPFASCNMSIDEDLTAYY